MKKIKLLLFALLFCMSFLESKDGCAKGMHKKNGICVMNKNARCAKGMHTNKDGVCVFNGNYQRIHIQNDYGRDVSVQLNFRQQKSPHSTYSVPGEVLKNRHKTFKAPFLDYKLKDLTVTPTAEAAAMGLGIAATSVGMTAAIGGTTAAAVVGTGIYGAIGAGNGVANKKNKNKRKNKKIQTNQPNDGNDEHVPVRGGTVSAQQKIGSGSSAAAGIGSFGISVFQGRTSAFGNTYFVIQAVEKIKGTATKGVQIIGYKNQKQYKLSILSEKVNKAKKALDNAIAQKSDKATIAKLQAGYDALLRKYNTFHAQLIFNNAQKSYEKAVAKKLDAKTIADLKSKLDTASATLSKYQGTDAAQQAAVELQDDQDEDYDDEEYENEEYNEDDELMLS